MIKRRGRSQIGNLTPDHKPLESRGQMKSDWSMLYTIGKIFSRAIRYCPHTLKKNYTSERYEHPNFWDNKSFSFGTPTWDSWGKVTFKWKPGGEAQSIL
jgi:hypothetical protein